MHMQCKLQTQNRLRANILLPHLYVSINSLENTYIKDKTVVGMNRTRLVKEKENCVLEPNQKVPYTKRVIVIATILSPLHRTSLTLLDA